MGQVLYIEFFSGIINLLRFADEFMKTCLFINHLKNEIKLFELFG